MKNFIKAPRIFCGMAVVLSLFICILPHFIFVYRIHTLQTQVRILQKEIQKNSDQKPLMTRKIFELAQRKQKLLLALFSCIAKSQIQWQSLDEHKENIILQGDAMQFSELQNFLLETEKNHLRFIIQKMEWTDILHFQLLMDKNHG